MSKSLPLIIIGVLLLIIAGFLYLGNNQQENNQEQMTQDESEQTPAPAGEYEEFSNDDFSMFYHEDMEINRNEAAPLDPVSFMLTGPTQTDNTELFDGINVTVRKGSYETESFEMFVNNEMDEIANDGVSEVISDMSEVEIGDKSGYEFTTQSLGEFRQIYFDTGNSEYVHVSVFAEDPEDQGFDNIVEQMLESLSF